MIGIVNYGMGNLTSVRNALNFFNIPNEIFDSPSEIKKYDKLILPGVGAFGLAMENIHETGFAEALQEDVLVKNKPLLGLCLGMQLLLDSSCEHGNHKGLGFIKGTVDYLGDRIDNLPIPHMGWNQLQVKKNVSLLFKNIPVEEQIYYFVHSFYCDLNDKTLVAAQTTYGISFDVVLEDRHIFGCQFHPEKSQKSGLQILKNFWEL